MCVAEFGPSRRAPCPTELRFGLEPASVGTVTQHLARGWCAFTVFFGIPQYFVLTEKLK